MYDALAHQLALHATENSNGVRVIRGTAILDGPYPKRLDDFIGQDLARRMILMAVEASAQTDNSLPHVLLASGIPGIGKTTLGRLIASLLQVGFVELGGTVTDKDAVKALRSMEDGDVMFLDEMHRLVVGGRGKAEWLLTLLQDGKVQTGTGVVQAPKITVIGATTDVEKLPSTIVERFPLRPILMEYSTPEAVQIARLTAKRLGYGTTKGLPLPKKDGWLRDVAKACDNNPRRMGSLLSSVRDVALATEGSNFDLRNGYDISLSLQFNGLTPDGLTSAAQRYLLALFANDGSAGAATVKAIVKESNLDHTEQLLLNKGYINVGARGRELTPTGRERAVELARASMAMHIAREGAA